MEGLKSEEQWRQWAWAARWTPMPFNQGYRHRCSQGVLFLGNGGTQTWKYNEFGAHENLLLVPTWSMRLDQSFRKTFVFFLEQFLLSAGQLKLALVEVWF